jgi:hypothetical protein
MKRTSLITLILGTALAVAPVAHAVRPTDDGGSSPISIQALNANMTQPEYRALMLRSAALNAKYGLGSATMSRPEYRALMLRSAALNAKYGLGSSSYTFRPDVLGGNGGTSSGSTATGGGSFDWNTLGIGAASLLGAMLLGLTSLAVTRRRHQPSF